MTGAFRSAVGEVPGFSLRSLGQPHLKNISEAIEVFAVEQTGDGKATARDRRARSSEGRARSAPDNRGAGRWPTSRATRATTISARRSRRTLSAALRRFRNLMVIARHSAFLFNLTANPTQEVQRKLGVRYILSGSLRKGGKRLRIAVELIDAASENAIWVRSVRPRASGSVRASRRDRGRSRRAPVGSDLLRGAAAGIATSTRHARLRAGSAWATPAFEFHQRGKLARAPSVRRGDRTRAGVQPRA